MGKQSNHKGEQRNYNLTNLLKKLTVIIIEQFKGVARTPARVKSL